MLVPGDVLKQDAREMRRAAHAGRSHHGLARIVSSLMSFAGSDLAATMNCGPPEISAIGSRSVSKS
jgi:hypothetical protein